MMGQGSMAWVSPVLGPILAVGFLERIANVPPEFFAPQWSPVLVGALIGVLSMATFYFSDRPIGASGAYAKVAGTIGMLVAPAHTKRLAHYRENPPSIDWEVMLVGFVVAGGFVAAMTGGEWTGRFVPPMWEARFGADVLLRVAATFVGGMLLAIGARIAGGCTSGHGISGTLQLSVGSWIALICFFIGGAISANLLYRL